MAPAPAQGVMRRGSLPPGDRITTKRSTPWLRPSRSRRASSGPTRHTRSLHRASPESNRGQNPHFHTVSLLDKTRSAGFSRSSTRSNTAATDSSSAVVVRPVTRARTGLGKAGQARCASSGPPQGAAPGRYGGHDLAPFLPRIQGICPAIAQTRPRNPDSPDSSICGFTPRRMAEIAQSCANWPQPL